MVKIFLFFISMITPLLSYGMHHKKQSTRCSELKHLHEQQTDLLPLCFCAQTIKQLSLLYMAYVVITSSIELKENIESIKTDSLWHIPVNWLQTGYYSSQCACTIGFAGIKLLIAHYISSWLVHLTCPPILRKKRLSDHATGTDC